MTAAALDRVLVLACDGLVAGLACGLATLGIAALARWWRER